MQNHKNQNNTVESDILKLKKDYTFDAFWNEDLKIYKCTYKFVGMPATKECCFTYTTKKDEVVLWGNNSYLMDEKSDIETYVFFLEYHFQLQNHKNQNNTVESQREILKWL